MQMMIKCNEPGVYVLYIDREVYAEFDTLERAIEARYHLTRIEEAQ